MTGLVRAVLLGLGLVALACGPASPGPAGGTGAASVEDARVGAAVGDRVPPFEIRTAEGAVSSSRLQAEGRPVFLFFFATW